MPAYLGCPGEEAVKRESVLVACSGVLMMSQIAEHCSSQADASMNDVRDRGRVEQCLKDHVAQKKITAAANKECFAVTSVPRSPPRFL